MKTPIRFLSVLALCLAAVGITQSARAMDGFTMKYGQMVILRGSHHDAMLDDMKIANGTLVMADGVVIQPNGKRFSIHDGDFMTFDGVLYRDGQMPPPAVATVTTQTTTVSTPAVAPAVVVVNDCVFMRGGQVMVSRGGTTYALVDSSIRLGDGTVVTRDGTVNTPDGRSNSLQNGDSITLDGRMRRSGM
jgi:hypothetical protein